MTNKQTVAWVLAHPDDETFGSACTIQEVIQSGFQAVLYVATQGEAGKTGRLGPMSKDELAAKRIKEMQQAANILDLSDLKQEQYPDSNLKTVDEDELIKSVTEFLNLHQPKIVVTFGEREPHPDHDAIHVATTKAVLSDKCPSVQKLYYFVGLTNTEVKPTIRFNGSAHWDTKIQALLAHESQAFSVERVFGDVNTLEKAPLEMKYENFVLAWEDGTHWPQKTETFLTDGLQSSN
ncbi:PIG-L deacetylase family protein [Desertibacillus haloalkaliphilus]|uniref:PIG-L deacetylase family protein n=1 Tax=Desertibacillus haloalkaliphilus TaxID=1328930 RepID=UPI001C259693|nr:PIG-L family deacetylase [Desertibacillus haloalkaliphilus]MBU8907994.1 PIG-L family deacetylase [Desertibacillus haloalkaliphilus]